ncbi:hypothetical protein QZH56_00390 [Streptomyces olivoreticuli]|uniref:hypothetical protein n=1 Tax=Streptomyces olivoreticuli TaxID=68246 RepID=UPI00265B542E|nr:hypothetical protein [Streptomyces olivoreticuli]WKK24191.1 hypothetical protein QZH56_00390 [Streptomyces olivoreticuli]
MLVLADAVDAAFDDIGEVIAGEVGQLAGFDGGPQQFSRFVTVRGLMDKWG